MRTPALSLIVAGLAAALSACPNSSSSSKGLPVGSACTAASDCASPPPAECLTEFMPLKGKIKPGTDPATTETFESIGLTFPGGYCSTQGNCATDADCGTGGTCYLAMAGVSQATIDSLASMPFDVNAFKTVGLCMKACTQSSDCREGYTCAWPLGDLLAIIGGTEKKFCIGVPAAADPCQAAPCKNGGTCTKTSDTGYSCQCTAAYTGTNCETAVGTSDPCQPNPCQNGGKCTKTSDTFACDCTDTGYEGAKCENAVGVTCAGTKYTDVIYRLVGEFSVKIPALDPLGQGENTYSDLGANTTSPVFDGAGNSTPFVAGTFSNGFARLRFTNDSSGNPSAGNVSLVEWYFPLNYQQQTFGVTITIDTDHSLGLLASDLSNCGSGDTACTNHAPTLSRLCAPNAQGSVSGTTLTWSDCTPTSGQTGWSYANAQEASGAGCAISWTAWGHAGPCSPQSSCETLVPKCTLGDSYQAWNQELMPLTFNGTNYKTASFTMDKIQVPNCTDPDTDKNAATTTWLKITSATVIGTQCGSTPGKDLVCDVQ